MKARFSPTWILGLLLLLIIVVAGCAPARADVVVPAGPDLQGPKTGQDVEGRLAMVDEVEVLIMESMPVQISLAVRGHLNDAVTRLDGVTKSREGEAIVVRIYTARDADAIGAQVLVPFEEYIRLDIAELGLEPGTYTVDVNGVITTLTLEAGMLGR